MDSLNSIKITPGDKDRPSLSPPIHNIIFTDIFAGPSEISLCPPPSPLVSSLSPNPTSNRSLLLDCYLLDHRLHPPFYVPLPLFPCYYTLDSPQEPHPAQWPSEVLARIPVPDCAGNPTTPVRLSRLPGLSPPTSMPLSLLYQPPRPVQHIQPLIIHTSRPISFNANPVWLRASSVSHIDV